MNSSRFRQTSLLVWKNFVLQKRRPFGTVVEIIVPILFTIVLVGVRQIATTTYNTPKSYCSTWVSSMDYNRPLQNGVSDFPSDNPYYCSTYPNTNVFRNYNALAFAPNTTDAWAVMTLVKQQFDLMSSYSNGINLTLVGFDTDDDISTIGLSSQYNFYGGIVFNVDDNGKKGGLGISGTKIHYTIRLPDSLPNNNGFGDGWETNLNTPVFQQLGPFNQPYTNTGFLVLQAAMDMAITVYLNGNNIPNFVPRVKPFPFPAYDDNGFVFGIKSILPLFLIMSYLYTAINIVREIVLEKERRLKEAMRMMGLSNAVLWISWFIKNVLFLIVTIFIITILFKVGKVFEHSDFGQIFFYLLLFMLSLIFYCFLVSVFFSRASVASAAGGIIFFIGYFPYFFIAGKYDSMSSAEKAASCLLAPTCVGIGANIISIFESNGQGLTVSTAGQQPSDGDSFTMNVVYGMLIIDCIIYMVLAWYIEAVFPGQYGIPRKPWFFLTRTYWCGHSGSYSKLVKDEDDDDNVPAGSDPADFQPDPDTRAGIQLQQLRKVYRGVGGTKIAVNNLNLNIYEGQVTALLGRNGAGKTTTMSMLVGMFPPSSGTAIVDGHDVVEDPAHARASMGLCPQFDILFDNLTVDEHLYFYARLKGMPANQIKPERDQFVTDLDLQPKRNALSHTLSGGQKRALSVAIAFIGGSKVVILDEPTSGMDPYKRRHTWDLILKYKQGRTILLTTHFMDEADLLGDRIAILGDGRLRCVGTPMFLKNRFGVGYHLTVVKNSSCDTGAVVRLISQMIPGAKQMGDVGSELSFLLPRDQGAQFPQLFTTMEDNRSRLGLDSYGVSVTTMEEVFLKVSDGIDSNQATAVVDTPSSKLPLMPKTELMTGNRATAQQMRGVFIKRMIHASRYRMAVVAQILLPVAFALAAILIAKTDNGATNQSSRFFNPSSSYGSNTAYRSGWDKGSDVWSSKNASLFTAYNQSGSIPASTSMSTLNSITSSFVSSDSRTSGMNLVDWTGSNMTSSFVSAEGDYLTNNFFKSHYFGFSFAADWFIVRDNAGACEFLIDGTLPGTGTWQRTDITVVSNTAYAFRGLPAMTAPTLPNIQFYTDAGLTNQVPNTLINYVNLGRTLNLIGQAYTQLYYVCSGSNPAQANVMTISSTISAPTAASGLTAYAWFSNKALHTSAEGLNLINNVLLRASVGSSAAINTYNWPLPRKTQDQIDSLKTDTSGFNLALFLIFGIGFLLPSFAIFIVSERASKSKHIQFVSGLNMSVYWFTNMIWDFAIFLFPAIAVVIVFAIFSIPAYSGNNLGVVFLLLVLCGWQAVPLVYVLSFLFSTPSSAYSRLSMIFIFAGIGALITVFVLSIPALDFTGTADIIKQVCFLLPNYAFSQAIYDMFYLSNLADVCSSSASAYQKCVQSNAVPPSLFSMTFPGIGRHIAFMVGYGAFNILLLTFLEFGLARFLNTRASNGSSRADVDEDVAAERQRIEAGASDPVVVTSMSKVFKVAGRPFTAVDNLSFGIPSKECFGLLGVNGAGKTTTFRMLTGDTPLSSGNVTISGFDLATQLTSVRRCIGYCPQYNGLVDLLTGRETLQYFARLRGYEEMHVHDVAENLIAEFDLTRIANKPCGSYSGGNKRKLSTAIALIGNPPIVFLDEPTTGMDPTSRRFIWNALARVLARGQSIVLTTHSMEECEALCTRLAIMVNGRFRCLGSVQHLKHRYGQGYQLKFKANVKNGNVDALKNFVASTFTQPVLKEEYSGEVTYQVDHESRGWAYMFAKCAEAQQLFNLEDYSVSQTTLEQVFLEFAKFQLAEDTKEKEKVDALKAKHEEDHKNNRAARNNNNNNRGNSNNNNVGRGGGSGDGGAGVDGHGLDGSKHYIPMASAHTADTSDAFAIDVAQARYDSPRSRESSGSGGQRDYSRIKLTKF